MNSVSPTRYIGAICPKHPELKGLRRKSHYACVGCTADARKRYKSQDHIRAKINEEKRHGRESEMIARKIARAVQNDIRVIACEMASKALKDPTKFQMFWIEAKEEYERRLQSTT